MALRYRLLPVGIAMVVSLLVLPQSYMFPSLLVLMFTAGCLAPNRPVAAATATASVFLLPCSVVLAVIGASWFPDGWHAFYPVRFGYPLRFPAAPAMYEVVGGLVGDEFEFLEPIQPRRARYEMVGDLVVQILYTWGWAVGAAYMGAGIALRLRKRSAAA